MAKTADSELDLSCGVARQLADAIRTDLGAGHCKLVWNPNTYPKVFSLAAA